MMNRANLSRRNFLHAGAVASGGWCRVILPAAQSATGDATTNQLDAAMQQNVRNQVAALGASPAILQPAVAAGKLEIVGAEYQLASGKVKLLS